MNVTNQLQFGAASEARAAVILAGLGFTGEARFSSPAMAGMYGRALPGFD